MKHYLSVCVWRKSKASTVYLDIETPDKGVFYEALCGEENFSLEWLHGKEHILILPSHCPLQEIYKGGETGKCVLQNS